MNPLALARPLRNWDRAVVRRMEHEIGTSDPTGGAGPLAARLYSRMRHEALYSAILRANVPVASAWKITLAVALRPGDVFFDVGGNVGRISQAAAWLVGAGGQVHAFEPSPEISGILRRRVGYFKLPQVTVNATALGARPGSAVLHEYTEGRGGSSSLRPGSSPGQEHDRETPVTVATLDEYVTTQAIRSLRLLKVDVEGAEIDVLQGACRTLDALRPILLVEASRATSAAFGHSLEDLVETIRARGYDIYSWRGNHLVAIETAADVPLGLHHDDFLCLDRVAHIDVHARLARLSRSAP